MEKINKINEQEMMLALERSGYLLESEITRRLVELGLFVEPNISSLDPVTGKSREIDLFAEFNHFSKSNASSTLHKIAARAKLIFEIKNNDFPLVLMTKYEVSPNSCIYESLKMGTTRPDNLKHLYYEDFYSVLFTGEVQKRIFTQYCSFSKKSHKDEFMANHPEHLYSSLLKITHYCEEQAEMWSSERDPKDEYMRNFLYLPVILINDDLYELENADANNHKLNKVDHSYLVLNYHYKEVPQTSIVYIITKAGLESFLNEIHEAEKQVEKNMLMAKYKVQLSNS
jgi:hypothetical protein